MRPGPILLVVAALSPVLAPPAAAGPAPDEKAPKVDGNAEKPPKAPRPPYPGPVMNATVRFGVDYQFRSAKGTENPYYLDDDGTQRFVELRNGGHAIGMSMEGWSPFGTIGVGAMLPAGGSVRVGDSETGSKHKYRNAAVWNFHLGPGLMSKRGFGIHAGYSYKYHHINFKDDVQVPGETIEYVLDYTFSRSTGPFVTAYLPLGRSFLIGGDYRGGGLRPSFSGERQDPTIGRYHEAALILYPHSNQVAAEGFFIRIGTHTYNLNTAEGDVRRTGGLLLQFSLSFTTEEFTEGLEEWNRVLIPPPSDPP